MYGIPNMKLDKGLVERRTELMAASGIRFRTGTAVGPVIDPGKLEADYDAVLIAAGSTRPRDLSVPGRNLKGIHFAMDYLKAATKRLLDSGESVRPEIDAEHKSVIVIGGGDTGNDCIGTAVRQGAVNVLNFELLPEPPRERTDDAPWPFYPRLLKDDYGHEEAKACFGRDPREYTILTKEFTGDAAGNLRQVNTVRVRWSKQEGGRFTMEEIAGSEETWEADMVFLAMGFLGPETELSDAFSLEKDSRSNILAPYGTYTSSRRGIFAAGDARRGQSLVVWAIHEGREAAREIDRYLMGETVLP
jgi:glutamate synthase (NADPH/NADH) small chain